MPVDAMDLPAHDETPMVPRELRAVEGLQHLDFLLNVVQVVLGSLELHHLSAGTPHRTRKQPQLRATKAGKILLSPPKNNQLNYRSIYNYMVSVFTSF